MDDTRVVHSEAFFITICCASIPVALYKRETLPFLTVGYVKDIIEDA